MHTKMHICIVFLCFLMYFYPVGAFKIYFEHEDSYYEIRSNEIDEESSTKLKKVNFIFPGTNWCGSGNVSDDNWSLGSAKETDACCREHDYCDDILEPGQTKFNLTNNSFHTKLHCRCDDEFYKCLKKPKLKMSNTVGAIYFNVLGTQCYRKDFPIAKCLRYHRYLRKRCEEYLLDTTQPEMWQWFDVPVY